MCERVEKYGVKRSGNSRYKAPENQRYSPVFWHFTGASVTSKRTQCLQKLFPAVKVTKRHALIKAKSS